MHEHAHAELQVDVQVERASRAVVAANTVTPNRGENTPAMETAVCKFFLTAEGCKLVMSASTSIHARMVSAFDVALMDTRSAGLDVVRTDTRFLHAHDLRSLSLAVLQSNRLKVRDVLHRPRLQVVQTFIECQS